MKKLLLITAICAFVLTACSGGSDKPSKEALSKKFVEALKNSSEDLSAEEEKQAEDYANCLFDEIYNDLSADDAKKLEKELESDTPFERDISELDLSNDAEKALNADDSECNDILM